MWTETYHRFADQVAFLVACDAAGWPPGLDGKTSPPAGVVLDVFGPAIAPLRLAGTLITPGAVDPRWHVNVSWYSGIGTPASFAVAEVIPERLVRMFAVRDPALKLVAVAIKAMFEVKELATADDPRLVAIADEEAIEKAG